MEKSSIYKWSVGSL